MAIVPAKATYQIAQLLIFFYFMFWETLQIDFTSYQRPIKELA